MAHHQWTHMDYISICLKMLPNKTCAVKDHFETCDLEFNADTFE